MQYVSYSKLGRDMEDHSGVSPMLYPSEKERRANQKKKAQESVALTIRKAIAYHQISGSPNQDYHRHNADWGWDNSKKRKKETARHRSLFYPAAIV